MSNIAAFVFLSLTLPIMFGVAVVFIAMFFQKLIIAVKDTVS